MKRIILVLLTALSASTFAQSIPNPGFETWVNSGSFEDPQGWGTFNFMSYYGNPITATKTTDKHSGTYAIRLESKLVTNNPNPLIYPDTIHTIYTGSTVPFVNGFAYTQKPAQIQMYYKSTVVNGSTAGILSYLFKWNSTTHRRDTIAYAASYMSAASTYTLLTVPFVYLNTTLTPDTAVIYTSPIAYGTPHQIGAVLFVDDVSFVNPTAVNPVKSITSSLYYSSGNLVLSNTNPVSVTVYSADGKIIFNRENMTSGSVELNVPAGSYIYKAVSSEGTFSGKFAVTK